MLRTYWMLAGFTAAMLGISLGSGACGGEATGGSGGSGASGGGSSSSSGSSSSGNSIQPPMPGPNKPGDGTGSTTFAVKKLYLGDTKRDGTPDKVNGWKEYGYDLDNKISTANATDLCKPRKGGNKTNVYPDGNGGIDNSFGKNILPIILGIATDASESINQGIASGSFTIMVDMEKLGSSADYNPLVARLYAGADLGQAPLFDGTDVWDVRPELLNDPNDIKSSKVQFATSYLTGNTWVSGSKGTITLNLSVQGFSLNLTIASALVAMDLSSDHKTATNGTIAGVIPTTSLVSEIQKIAGSFDPSFCDPMNPTLQSILTQLEQASDILQDGSQDPSKECDGISVGLGFDAATVQLGAVAPPSMPGPDPCAP